MADERARHDGRGRGDGEAFHGLSRIGREDCDAAKGRWRGFRSGSRALFAFAAARKRSRDRSPGISIPELPRARSIRAGSTQPRFRRFPDPPRQIPKYWEHPSISGIPVPISRVASGFGGFHAGKQIDIQQLLVVLSATVPDLAKHLLFVWNGIAKHFHRFVDAQHALGISCGRR